MSRLIAFGCSHTYGQGLADIVTENDPTGSIGGPSICAWPVQLAGRLGKEIVVNNARPGSSNKEILNRVLDFEYQKNDTVVILWTYFDRWYVHKKNYLTHIYVNPWKEDQPSQVFYKMFYDEKDMQRETQIRMCTASLYLTKNKIKNYHASVLPFEKHKWFNNCIVNCTFDGIWKQNKLSCGHLNEQGHILFSNSLYNFIMMNK